MAEPVNTPMPPGTPMSATPRSTSPAPPPPPLPAIFPPITPRSSSYTTAPKPVVLHLGDSIRCNSETYTAFLSLCTVVRPSEFEYHRRAFIQALRERRWGDFSAVFRPSWATGGEMGRWDEELISLLPPSVTVFASAGAEFDWVDTKLLAERGIVYCGGGLEAAQSVAHFGTILIDPAVRASGQDPSACTLGLIGFGSIGQQIARKTGLSLGMQILYYDTERKPADVEQQIGAKFCGSLEELCGNSDFVLLCTPVSGNSGTLINAQSLRWFRPGARFLNIARGGLVDEAALADALEQDRLSSVTLGVYHDEPQVHDRLRHLATDGDRVVLAQYTGLGEQETHAKLEELTMRNVMAVLEGKQPITPVNLQWLKRE